MGVVCPDDSTLRASDEIQDGVTLLALRESGLDLGAAVGDVVAGEVDRVVDVLDVADDIRREPAAAESHDVHT